MPCGMREEVRAVPGLRVGAGCGVSQDRGEDVAQQLAAAVSAGLDVVFDRGHPVDAALHLTLTLPVELLDGIDPVDPAPDAAAALSGNLATFARLAVDVRRP